jgi:hypothetical protein
VAGRLLGTGLLPGAVRVIGLCRTYVAWYAMRLPFSNINFHPLLASATLALSVLWRMR